MSTELLAQALRDIIDPIAYIEHNMEEGCRLDGHAALQQISSREFYVRLAREALAAHEALAAAPAEPALWVSPKQLEAHDPQTTGKPNYLPAMKRSEGLFTMPLYTHPAPQPQQAGVALPMKLADEFELRRLLAEERETTRQLVRALREAIEEPVFMGEPIRTSAPPPQAPAPAPQAQAVSQWLPIETAPRDGTRILVSWPMRELDDDECATGPIRHRSSLVTEMNGSHWLEPDVLNAAGAYFGDDYAYADEPDLWMPLAEPPASASQKEPT